VKLGTRLLVSSLLAAAALAFFAGCERNIEPAEWPGPSDRELLAAGLMPEVRVDAAAERPLLAEVLVVAPRPLAVTAAVGLAPEVN
jgi:hypothetical protein